jgi:signal transduction histidine kinase
MHGLIRDLLDSVRLDEGQLRLDLVPIDVGRLACNVVARLSDPDAERVEVTVEPGLPPVASDAQRLERVLANLIGNALHYGPTSAPVRVAVEASDGQLRVSVQDEGPGIDPDELPRLFQCHGRTSSGLARSDSFGLGLYIVRGIVAVHDGWVWVDSVVGRGSTFGFTVPLASPSPATHRSRSVTPRPRRGAARSSAHEKEPGQSPARALVARDR